ncbi:aromatic-ring hydroxylase C-terminal domain-containing protein [Streptomyces bobili]
MARPRGRYACREADRERPRSASSASGTAGRGADSGLRPSCRGTAASGSGGSWSRSWTASAWPAWYDLGDDHRVVGTLCPDMKLTLERPDPEVVTAVTRSADLPREQRELLLDLVDRAKARDAAASWTGRVNTVPPGTDRVDADALLIRPHGCLARALPTGAGPRRHHAGACAGHMVRPTGLSTALTVVSGSLRMK